MEGSDDAAQDGERAPRTCDLIRLAASQSFTPDEVRVLDEILRLAVRGGDIRTIARSQSRVLGALHRKAYSMARAIDRKREIRAVVLAARDG